MMTEYQIFASRLAKIFHNNNNKKKNNLLFVFPNCFLSSHHFWGFSLFLLTLCFKRQSHLYNLPPFLAGAQTEPSPGFDSFNCTSK